MAHKGVVGKIAAAEGGTLFLDEVAELPLPLQAKLLRVLETRRVAAVGGEQEVAVEVRVVAATHQPLEALIAAGRFRGDLYHRLSALQIDLPPLRQRREDIPALLEHFAGELALEFARPIVITAPRRSPPSTSPPPPRSPAPSSTPPSPSSPTACSAPTPPATAPPTPPTSGSACAPRAPSSPPPRSVPDTLASWATP